MTAKEFWNTQIPTDVNKCYVHDFYAKKFSHDDLFHFAEAYTKLETTELLKQRDELLEAAEGIAELLPLTPTLEDWTNACVKLETAIIKTKQTKYSDDTEDIYVLKSEALKAINEVVEQRDELLESLKELMEGVRGLPPLTAIVGVLTKQYEKAQLAITKTTER